jgi:Ca2+-binding EF-hand superfamily protein
MPPDPAFLALDTDHDGVISADEINHAPAALRTLDKNGDGLLTEDEVRPAFGGRGRGPR